MKVRLSEREVHQAASLGRDTTSVCRMQNTKPRGESGRDSSDINGARAEFAVAKLFGIDQPTLNIAGDGHIDLWLGNISIDVKWTASPYLIFDDMSRFQADVAVLVRDTEDPSVLHVDGVISRSRFESECDLKDMKYGTKLVVSKDALWPIESLWSHWREVSLA